MKLLLVGLLISSSVWSAWGEVGNGGHAVVCYRNPQKIQIESIELFDYWEMARELTPAMDLNLGGPRLSVSGKLQVFANRLSPYDFSLAEAINNEAQEIAANISEYLSDVPLAIIEDDNARIGPKEPCYREQFAVQVKTDSPSRKKILISERLYNHPRTTNDVRAGIILHEVIYRMFIANGATNSLDAREFHFTLASDRLSSFNETNLKFYQKLMKVMALPAGSTTTLWMPNVGKAVTLWTATIKDMGENSFSGRLFDDLYVDMPNARAKIKKMDFLNYYKNGNLRSIYGADGPLEIKVKNQTYNAKSVSFDVNGWINHFEPVGIAVMTTGKGVAVSCEEVWSYREQIRLHENGSLKSCNVAGKLLIDNGGYAIDLEEHGYHQFELKPDGNFVFFWAGYNDAFIKPSGCDKAFKVTDTVTFTDDNRIKDIILVKPIAQDGYEITKLGEQVQGCLFKAEATKKEVLYNGNKMVAPVGMSSEELEEVGEKICTSYGSKFYSFFPSSFNEVFVENDSFYNWKTDSVMTVKRDFVRKASVTCEKKFYVNPGL